VAGEKCITLLILAPSRSNDALPDFNVLEHFLENPEEDFEFGKIRPHQQTAFNNSLTKTGVNVIPFFWHCSLAKITWGSCGATGFHQSGYSLKRQFPEPP
jgi:hypothetical protein